MECPGSNDNAESDNASAEYSPALAAATYRTGAMLHWFEVMRERRARIRRVDCIRSSRTPTAAQTAVKPSGIH